MSSQYIAVLSCPTLSRDEESSLNHAVKQIGGSPFFRIASSAQRLTLPSGTFSFEAESAGKLADHLALISLPAQAGVALKIDFAVLEVTDDSCFGGVQVDEHGTRLFREDRTCRPPATVDAALAAES